MRMPRTPVSQEHIDFRRGLANRVAGLPPASAMAPKKKEGRKGLKGASGPPEGTPRGSPSASAALTPSAEMVSLALMLARNVQLVADQCKAWSKNTRVTELEMAKWLKSLGYGDGSAGGGSVRYESLERFLMMLVDAATLVSKEVAASGSRPLDQALAAKLDELGQLKRRQDLFEAQAQELLRKAEALREEITSKADATSASNSAQVLAASAHAEFKAYKDQARAAREVVEKTAAAVRQLLGRPPDDPEALLLQQRRQARAAGG